MRPGTVPATALLAAAVLTAALAGCTATPAPTSPAPTPAATTPAATTPPAAAAIAPAPSTLDLAATTEAPALAREVLGSAEPGDDAQFGALVTELSLLFPGQYVEGEWRADEVPPARVVLLGTATGELRQLLEAAPLAVEVVTTPGPSLEESNAAIERVFALLKEHDAAMSASGGYEQLEQRYTIDYTAANPIDAAEVGRLLDGAAVRLTWLGTDPMAGTGPQAEAL
jgi:hypothetical protein